MKSGKAIERVAGAYVASLYAHPAFQALKAREAGCLLAWGRMMLDAGKPALPLDELRSHATYFAHLDEADFSRMLTELRAMRLVAVDESELLELIPMASAMRGMFAESERRKGGWQKRRQQVPNASVATSASSCPSPGPAEPLSVAPASSAGQASLLGIEPFAAPATPAKKKAAISPNAEHVRVGATDDDVTPVIVRLDCKGDRTVEFTEGFAISMKAVYPGVDVHTEMLRAAEWCRGKPERKKTLKGARSFITGWLSRSAQRRDVTMAVVAAGNSRNGFGQGGGYVAPAAAGTTDVDFDDLTGLDDFSDFIAPKKPTFVAQTARLTQQSQHPQTGR